MPLYIDVSGAMKAFVFQGRGFGDDSSKEDRLWDLVNACSLIADELFGTVPNSVVRMALASANATIRNTLNHAGMEPAEDV